MHSRRTPYLSGSTPQVLSRTYFEPEVRGGGYLLDWLSLARPAVRLQHLFPQPQRLRCYLDQLIVRDKLDGLLQGLLPVRHQPQGLIRRTRPHIGELLLPDSVDVQIVVARVLAHDHALETSMPSGTNSTPRSCSPFSA